MITARIVGVDEALAKWQSKGGKMQDSIGREVLALTIDLQRHVVQDKLQGQVLTSGGTSKLTGKGTTGTLARGINQRVTNVGNRIIGRVGTNVEYAAAHEYGASINIPEIVAKGRALMFTPKGGSAPIFRKSVAAHVVLMPERSFLRSALADFESQIAERLQRAMSQGAEQ